MIVFEYQVVFIVSDLDRSAQVTRLETTFENESLIVIALFRVKWAQFRIVTIDFRYLLIESRRLPRRTIRIVLPMVHWVLLRRQLNEIVLVDVRSVVVGVLLLRWVVEAIVHDLFSLALVHAALGVDASVFFAHGCVELVDGLEVAAPVAVPRSVTHERLVDAGSRELHIDLWLATCS